MQVKQLEGFKGGRQMKRWSEAGLFQVRVQKYSRGITEGNVCHLVKLRSVSCLLLKYHFQVSKYCSFDYTDSDMSHISV